MSDQQVFDATDEVATRLRSGTVPLSALEAPALAEAGRLLRSAGWIELRGNDIAVSSRRGLVIGLDLGGTKLRGAIGDMTGTILNEREEPTAHHATDSTLVQMADMARRLVSEAGVSLESVEAMAVGVPGVVGPDGRVALSPNVSFGSATPLAETLQDLIGVPVSVDNDGNLSAFGEYATRRAANPHLRSLAFLAIGTGVGMGLIVDGHLLHGSGGGAGEIAFLPFGNDPFAAARHPGGAFEAAVASDGIKFAYAARTGVERGVREVFDLADAGEAAAAAVVAETTRNIAVGVAAVVALLDPGVVVMGGGIGARPGLAQQVARHTTELVPTPCAIVPSALGERAGVVGAVAFACRQARLRLVQATPEPENRGAAA